MHGVPADATAVVLNVTGIGATTNTYLAVTPTPTTPAPPTTSTINLRSGVTLANGATVAIGTDGKVRIVNHSGTVNVVADLTGYYTG